MTQVIGFSWNFSPLPHRFQATWCAAFSCLFLISLFEILTLLCIAFVNPNPPGFDRTENGRLRHSRKDADACVWILFGVFQLHLLLFPYWTWLWTKKYATCFVMLILEMELPWWHFHPLPTWFRWSRLLGIFHPTSCWKALIGLGENWDL